MIFTMGEHHFLLFYIGVVILLVFIFLRVKKKDKPSQIRLTESLVPKNISERRLNCLFQYNGHTWDAHEVLGIPAGCSWEMIQKGLDDALAKAQDANSKEFLKAAYDALKDSSKL